MKRALIAVLALLLMALTAGVSAQDGLALMRVEPNARPAGMGGAFVAVSGGPDAVPYNPAGAWTVTDVAGSFGHDAYWENIRLESGFLATRLSPRFVLHAGIRYAAIDQLQKRGYIPTEEPLSLFEASDASFKLGAAYRINDQIAAGAALGWFFEKIDQWSGWAFNLDLGLQAKATDHLNVGASITSIGSDFTLTRPSGVASDPIPLPTTYRAGVAYTLDRYTGTADFVYLDSDAHLHLGVEARLHELFRLRAGYMVNYDTKNFTAGASFVQRNLTVDYAFIPYSHNLGTTHMFNLTFTL